MAGQHSVWVWYERCRSSMLNGLRCRSYGTHYWMKAGVKRWGGVLAGLVSCAGTCNLGWCSSPPGSSGKPAASVRSEVLCKTVCLCNVLSNIADCSCGSVCPKHTGHRETSATQDQFSYKQIPGHRCDEHRSGCLPWHSSPPQVYSRGYNHD